MATVAVHAQDSFEQYKQRKEAEFNEYADKRNRQFEDFRNKINAEFAAMIEKTWREMEAMKATPQPKEVPPVPPLNYPKEDQSKPEDNPQPVVDVEPVPQTEPQPMPIVPIEEAPQPTPVISQTFAFQFFGTQLNVRLQDSQRFTLNGCNEQVIAQAWKRMSDGNYDNVVYDCLQIRSANKLCDWAYLLMLQDLANRFYGKQCNESVLLMAYIYCQSGYKMRLALSGNNLCLLYASRHQIYDVNYWMVDGEQYYPLDENIHQARICQVAFPNEKPLSLLISNEQQLAMNVSSPRRLQSKRYADIKANVTVNTNLIKFFDSYPTSMINQDFGTRWALYANTPMSAQAKNTLYPTLRMAISGKSNYEAVSRLLNFVQTAFVYETDDEVWGSDRAFFAEETLYYPYCDCEDRAILFSRLVRDLVGLKVALIYYPGHLAAAVQFDNSVTGDYVMLGNQRYVVCDPTYIGAPIGKSMPNLNYSKARAILLD
jgi:hypothetical protein